jgi:hypothetical protein
MVLSFGSTPGAINKKRAPRKTPRGEDARALLIVTERNLNSTKVYMSCSRKVSSVAAFCVWIHFRDRDMAISQNASLPWTAAFYAFARVSSPGLYLPSPRACSDSTPAIKHNAIGVQRSTFVHCIIDPVSLTIAKVLLAAGGVGVAVSIKDENNLSIGARVASGLTGAPADKVQSWYDATAYDAAALRHTMLYEIMAAATPWSIPGSTRVCGWSR